MPRRRNTDLQNQINRTTGIANSGRRQGFAAMNRNQNAFQSGYSRSTRQRNLRPMRTASVRNTQENDSRVTTRTVRRYDASQRDPQTGFGRTVNRTQRIFRGTPTQPDGGRSTHSP